VRRIAWQHVDRTDPHDSGWWVLARLIVDDDGSVIVETNTRGSVVSTEVPLDAEAARTLAEVLAGLSPAPSPGVDA
jgi:hypothetical protein